MGDNYSKIEAAMAKIEREGNHPVETWKNWPIFSSFARMRGSWHSPFKLEKFRNCRQRNLFVSGVLHLVLVIVILPCVLLGKKLRDVMNFDISEMAFFQCNFFAVVADCACYVDLMWLFWSSWLFFDVTRVALNLVVVVLQAGVWVRLSMAVRHFCGWGRECSDFILFVRSCRLKASFDLIQYGRSIWDSGYFLKESDNFVAVDVLKKTTR